MTGIFNLIARMATACGVKTQYVISWRYLEPGQEVFGDGAYLVTPWLRGDDLPKLREYLAASINNSDQKKLNIVSITRIGR